MPSNICYYYLHSKIISPAKFEYLRMYSLLRFLACCWNSRATSDCNRRPVKNKLWPQIKQMARKNLKIKIMQESSYFKYVVQMMEFVCLHKRIRKTLYKQIHFILMIWQDFLQANCFLIFITFAFVIVHINHNGIHF